MTESALLTVEDLSIGYGQRAVVSELSFELAAGRCLGVIGESGAGKSQTFLSLLGLLPPAAHVTGRARLGDVPLLSSGAALRGRDVAMIFQDPMTSLTPHLRVGAQIAEPLILHRGMSRRDARARAGLLLDQVGINDVTRRLDQYPHELSGGMRQRVMIAMALACGPRLLIADEPTSALDVSVQAQILALLRQLMANHRMAMAVVTHDMGVIAALADDVLVMQGGRVVERGDARQILATPRHEYTRALLAATPRMQGALLHDTEAPRTEPALEVRRLAVRHRLRQGWLRRPRDLVAVDDVSFGVGTGEALGIVGESGSGKSTLVRALLRLGPRPAGEVLWLGRPIQDLAGRALRGLREDLQIVFQDPFASLDPTMSVEECVAEPLRALRPSLSPAERARRVADALDSVGLGADFAARRSPTLSGGQCQRVAIARAMIVGPKLLVCDEAVSALDVSIQAQILELLADIRRREGTSLVFVSHNLAVVRRLCERVLVMYLGRIVESGTTDTVFGAPRHPYTRMLLDSVPLLDADLERARLARLAVRGEVPSAVDRPRGCEFHLRCPRAQERCAATRPETETIDNSHRVACLRWREPGN